MSCQSQLDEVVAKFGPARNKRLPAQKAGGLYKTKCGNAILPERAHSRWKLHFRDSEAVDLNIELVIDSHAVDAVSLRNRSSLGQRGDYRSIDDECDLVGRNADFKSVRGRSAGVGLFHCGTGCLGGHSLR
jgi:hypothetical protein